MSEKISILELINGSYTPTLLNSAILNSLTDEIQKDIIPGETKELELDFYINGKQTSLRSFFEHLNKEMDRIIEVEAANLLRKRLGEDDGPINDIQRMLKKVRNEMFEKHFPNDPEFLETKWD